MLPGILSTALITGCASIESFHAAPRNVCTGDIVNVTWQAKGTVELTSTPPAHQTSASSSEGSAQFVVQESTRFALKASRLFSKKTALADVVMVARESKEFGDLAQCESPAEGVGLALVLKDPQVSSALQVATVTNMNARPIVLRKENVRVAIMPGQTSSAFSTQPAAGAWEITAALNPRETCDEALAELHDRLSIRIAFSCRE
ncbi:hypothetical protein [Nitrospira sp. BLG_1]|uniref:hypothetical protein n=1 Tax=Nitrospira sp. BLG_1 TaxID=3395883 RepID=UPI0039BCF7FA